jgi:tetratricopeptide (TPR) repeat protein
MANIRRLMAEVRRLEESDDLEEAIVVYRQALAVQEETTGFADLGLYNGLGDLYLRFGDLDQAVQAFEEAAEHCEDQQLYSNGIAVCKKILRNAPDCVRVYRRVGRLLALSGLEAESLANYRIFCEGMETEGHPSQVIEALSEFVEITADLATVLELSDLLVAADRGHDALVQLRATRDRREKEGKDIVALVRRIQELQPRPGADQEPSTEASASSRSTGAKAADGASTASATADAATPLPEEPIEPDPSVEKPAARRPDSDVASLMDELHDVLARLDGVDRFRHALPIVDHLLEFQPHRFELLHRKLAYAYALGEEAATIEAFLALADCLDRTMDSFSIRALSTSSSSGEVTTAINVGERSEMAPTP